MLSVKIPFAPSISRLLRVVSSAGAVAALLLSVASVCVWNIESAEVQAILGAKINRRLSKSEQVREVLSFFDREVGDSGVPSAFLFPILDFLRPSALEIIRHGGDCGFRARAFIVLLHGLGINSSKLALYNEAGEAVHAVVRVETERGTYVVDLLYNILHEDQFGKPISLKELSKPKVLRASVQRSIDSGNLLAKEYSFEEYTYQDVRSIDWNRNILTRIAYPAAIYLFGIEKVRNAPRPYFFEEPGLMLGFLGIGLASLLTVSGSLLSQFGI